MTETPREEPTPGASASPTASTRPPLEAGKTDGEHRARPAFTFEPLSLSHLIQLGIGLTFAIAAIRIMIVTGGDPAIAGEVLRSQGFLTTIMALGVSATPILLLLAVGALLNYRGALVEAGEKNHWLSVNIFAIILAPLLILLPILPWYMFILYTLGFVAMWWTDRWARKRIRASPTATVLPPKEYKQLRLRESIVMVITPLIMIVPQLLVQGGLWIPREQLSIVENSNTTVITGYVLSLDSPWTTVLLHEPRQLMIVKTESISERTTCASNRGLPVGQALRKQLDDAPPPADPCKSEEVPDPSSAPRDSSIYSSNAASNLAPSVTRLSSLAGTSSSASTSPGEP